MNEKIRIDFVSDVVCPWCLIGYKRLEKAIRDLDIKDKVELTWQPFQLNPHMPNEGQDLVEHLGEKYGSSIEQQRDLQERIEDFGSELGFNFNFSKGMKMLNTFKAHVLLDYAEEKEKQTELKLRLFTAYFNEGKDVSKEKVLLEEAESIGLDIEEIKERLNDKAALETVKSNENYWKNLGVSSVPTVIFNRKSDVAGAQNVSYYEEVLSNLINEKEYA